MKRRVQTFVLLAIAVFVSGGFAARSLWIPRQSPPPATEPASDMAVVPTPKGIGSVRSKAPRAPRRDSSHPAGRTTGTQGTATRPATAAPAAVSDAVSSKAAAAETAAVRLTNAQRARHGCPALRIDVRLRAAARRHSADMHRRHFFAHESPDGRTPWDRIRATGYGTPGAENIARGQPTAQAVVAGWMNSPGHRANILDCGLKAVGIGVDLGQGGPWWTQDFGFR